MSTDSLIECRNFSVFMDGEEKGRLVRGSGPFSPAVRPLTEGGAPAGLSARLAEGVKACLADRLGTLVKAREKVQSGELGGSARALLYRLVEEFGLLPASKEADLVRSLSEAERKKLAGMKIAFGVENIFFSDLLKPDAQKLRADLWNLWHETAHVLPLTGQTSMPAEKGVPADFARAVGYVPAGARLVRADVLERFTAGVRQAVREGGEKGENVQVPPELLSIAGLKTEDALPVLTSLGYRASAEEEAVYVTRGRKRKSGGRKKTPATGRGKADSPFSVLKDLKKE